MIEDTIHEQQASPFSTPRRQSTVAIVIFIYNFLVRILKGFWPVLFVLVFRSSGSQSRWELITNGVIAVAALFSLVISVISYFRYYYFTKEDKLVINQGVINKKRTTLPFERIQHLNIEQKVIHRIFDVVSLKIDSAGSVNSEITIEALQRSDAEALRKYVLARRGALQPDAEPGTEAETQAEEVREELLHLSVEDLLKIGVSQNHLRTAGIIFGTVTGFLFTIIESIDIDPVKQLEENEMYVRETSFYFFFGLAVILFVLAFILTLLTTVSRYYDLRFLQSNDRFELNAGLLNRRETSLRKEKVQLIRWRDNPVRRFFKIFTLEIRQARAGSRASDKLMIPGCYQDQVDKVLASGFPESVNEHFTQHRIDKAYIGWYYRYLGLLPAIALGAAYYFSDDWRFLLLAGLVLIIAYFWLRTFYKKYQLSLGKEHLRTRSGVIGTEYMILQYYKIQSVEIRQSFYQRRRKLANLVMHTAGGTRSIPFLPLEKAIALQDYLLYKIESTNRSWM